MRRPSSATRVIRAEADVSPLPSRLVRDAHRDFRVESTCSPQCRIERVGSVCGAENHDRFVVRLVPGEVCETFRRFSSERWYHCPWNALSLTVHASQQLRHYPPFHFSLSSLSFRCNGVDFVYE